MKDGRYHGTFESYYETGKIRSRGTYKNDSREGSFEYFNEDGSIDGDTGIYKDGVKQE